MINDVNQGFGVNTETPRMSVGFVLELDNLRNAARWRVDGIIRQLLHQLRGCRPIGW